MKQVWTSCLAILIVWACKNRLAEDGIFDRLFDEFRTFLDNKGLSFNEGKIIDATFVEAPKQRNTKEENRQIKAGNGKDLWNPEEHGKQWIWHLRCYAGHLLGIRK